MAVGRCRGVVGANPGLSGPLVEPEEIGTGGMVGLGRYEKGGLSGLLGQFWKVTRICRALLLATPRPLDAYGFSNLTNCF